VNAAVRVFCCFRRSALLLLLFVSCFLVVFIFFVLCALLGTRRRDYWIEKDPETSMCVQWCYVFSTTVPNTDSDDDDRWFQLFAIGLPIILGTTIIILGAFYCWRRCNRPKFDSDFNIRIEPVAETHLFNQVKPILYSDISFTEQSAS
jgi:hypothetical protein